MSDGRRLLRQFGEHPVELVDAAYIGKEMLGDGHQRGDVLDYLREKHHILLEDVEELEEIMEFI